MFDTAVVVAAAEVGRRRGAVRVATAPLRMPRGAFPLDRLGKTPPRRYLCLTALAAAAVGHRTSRGHHPLAAGVASPSGTTYGVGLVALRRGTSARPCQMGPHHYVDDSPPCRPRRIHPRTPRGGFVVEYDAWSHPEWEEVGCVCCCWPCAVMAWVHPPPHLSLAAPIECGPVDRASPLAADTSCHGLGPLAPTGPPPRRRRAPLAVGPIPVLVKTVEGWNWSSAHPHSTHGSLPLRAPDDDAQVQERDHSAHGRDLRCYRDGTTRTKGASSHAASSARGCRRGLDSHGGDGWGTPAARRRTHRLRLLLNLGCERCQRRECRRDGDVGRRCLLVQAATTPRGMYGALDWVRELSCCGRACESPWSGEWPRNCREGGFRIVAAASSSQSPPSSPCELARGRV